MLEILKSVSKHFVIYGFGNMLTQAVGFLLIPVYTHYLTPSDYGTLELLELTSSITGMFLGAGITYAVLRFYYDSDDPIDRKLVVSTAHVSIIIIAISLGSGLVLSAPGISTLIFQTAEYGVLLQLTFITLIISVVSMTPMVFIRAQQKSLLFTSIAVGRFALSLGLNILFLVGFGWGIRGIIFSSLTSQALVAVVVSTYTFRNTGIGFSLVRLKQMLAYGLPFVPGGLGRFVLNFADRFLLPRFTSLSELGIYSLGYKFGMVINPLVSDPFHAIWAPKMLEVSKRKDAAEVYSIMLTYFLFVALFVGLGVSILIKDALIIISDPAFHRAYKIVPLIVLSYVLGGAYYMVQVGILVAKQTRYVAYIVGVAASANVVLNLLLIRPLGLWGAAIATLVSFAVLVILSFWISNRFLKITYQSGRLLKLLVVASILYLLSLPIRVESLWLTMMAKFLLALTFPLCLAFVRFYSDREISKIKELLGIAVTWLRTPARRE